MNKLMVALAAAALLAGCASTPLEQAPVVDSAPRATAAATPPPAQARSQVAPVIASPAASDAAGPAGTARIVYFAYDSAAIRAEFQPLIDSHASFLNRHHERKLVIGGHTDERGGHEYNLALGQQRAEAVRRALHLLGVPDTQVETISFGEEKPASEGHAEAAWAVNRRAELVYR